MLVNLPDDAETQRALAWTVDAMRRLALTRGPARPVYLALVRALVALEPAPTRS